MTSRVALVAEKDFRDSFREGQFYYIGVLFLLIGLLFGYLMASSGASGNELISLLLLFLLFIAPATTLSISHDTIAEKWSNGELTVLLGLPFARSDVVYGSVVGRSAVVAVVSVITIVFTTLFGAAFGAVPDMDVFALGTLALVLVVAIFASLAVAFSTLSKSTRISATGAFGVFLLFIVGVWEWLPGIANFVLDRLGVGTISGDAVDVWNNLTPMAAVRNLIAGMSESAADPFGGYAPALSAGSPPVYQHPIVAALLVVFWVAVPVTLAYWRFTSMDV